MDINYLLGRTDLLPSELDSFVVKSILNNSLIINAVKTSIIDLLSQKIFDSNLLIEYIKCFTDLNYGNGSNTMCENMPSYLRNPLFHIIMDTRQSTTDRLLKIKFLVEDYKYVDINYVDENGRNALSYAFQVGSEDIFWKLYNYGCKMYDIVSDTHIVDRFNDESGRLKIAIEIIKLSKYH